jgi:hypothetical protein
VETDAPARASQSTESTIRVAVTGHRNLDAANLEAAVRRGLALIRERFDGHGGAAPLVVLSALAEGADQLVARVVLEEPGSSLEVSLPLPVGDYRGDFSVEGLRGFDDLLPRAAIVRTAPSFPSRDEAYAWAGRDVVDRCDVLLAIWDGRPSRGHGGTAEVVAYAHAACVPLVWIESAGEHRLRTDWSRAPTSDPEGPGLRLGEHHRFLSTERLKERTARQRERWLAGTSGTTLPLDALAEWVLPAFVRADALAEHFQALYITASTSVFVLAALALTAVAVHATFFPDVPWVVGGEFAFLVILVALVLLSRARRWNDQWISYRYLAERLRSAYFLAIAGTSDRRPADSSPTFTGDPAAQWIKTILAETSARRPPDDSDGDVAEIRAYLSQHWIEDQARYHCSVSRRHQSSDVIIKRCALLLFCLALGVCGIRMLGLGESEGHLSVLGQTLVALSIAVPAFGAATHGIGGLREHRRQAERSARMAELLRALRPRMEQAPDIESVREVAAATEHVMREENGDWFGAMRFHEVELIS